MALPFIKRVQVGPAPSAEGGGAVRRAGGAGPVLGHDFWARPKDYVAGPECGRPVGRGAVGCRTSGNLMTR